MARARHAVAMGLVVLCTALGAQASPADLFGFGPESQGMAGLGTAVGRGFGTTYANPALLSRSHQRELALGYQLVGYSLYARGPNAPGDLSAEGLHGEFIGVVLPVPFGGVLEDRITLGLGVFTPSKLIARARLLYPERPQFPLLTDRAQSLNFNLGLGADIGHGLRVGAGFMALAELVGTVVVRTDTTGRVGTGVDDQLIATYAPIVGAAWDFEKDWTAGLTWRGALEGDFDVLVQVNDLGSLTVPDLHISGVAQYDPMQLQAEIGHEMGPWTFAAGAIYRHWGAFHGWQKATVECPPSLPDCQALKVEPIEFHDTIAPRAGARYAFSLTPDAKAEIRAGYAFEPTPLGAQTGSANYFDSDRHVIAAGYGLDLAEPLPPIKLDFFYQLQLLTPRTHDKGGGVDSANAGYPHVKTGGLVMNTGVVAGVKF
jgi:long-chain fatty acid transport protein